MDMQDTFGNIIKGLREQKQLTLKEVADYLEIDFSMLARIEKGQRSINESHFGLLATLFDVNERELRIHALADQVFRKIQEYEFAEEVLDIVSNQIKEGKK